MPRALPSLCAALLLALATLSYTAAVQAQTLNEDFDSVSKLSAAGWVTRNNSTVAAPNHLWTQGEPTTFSNQDPADFPDAYAGVGSDSTLGEGANETLSNWLLTPQGTLTNTTAVSFYTRTVDTVLSPDRLEVRLSASGASANVGTGAEDVGDFTRLLLTVNPTLTADGYPSVWTQYTITFADLSAAVTGRIGFRYYVIGGGQSGINGNYIGIDTLRTNAVTVVSAPEAGTATLCAVPLLLLVVRVRRARRVRQDTPQ